MIKKILLPTDYSEASLNALETAVTIAENNEAAIHILHVADTSCGHMESPSLEKARHICDAMAGSMLLNHGIKTEVIFDKGIIGPTIVKTAFEKKPDLIVMGAHGASGQREFFIGSNAYYVIKNAGCPVLTIPEGGKRNAFNKVLFPVRPTAKAYEQCNFIQDLMNTRIGSPELELFGINKHENDASRLTDMARSIKNGIDGNNITLFTSFSSHINIAEEVLDKANIAHADLLVVSSDIDAVDQPFFIGPFSQRIINHAHIPVLSV